MNNVVIIGYDSASETSIISEVNGNFSVSISGNMTNYYDVYCNNTDTCYVDCQSTLACQYMRLHCKGTCYVHCNHTINGNINKHIVQCPYSGNYSLWSLDDTIGPSTQPTMNPIVNTSILQI